MKGVGYLTDENNHKKAVVIDIKTIERYDEELEDLFDGIIAESRKNDEKAPLKKVISNLKKAGKLKSESNSQKVIVKREHTLQEKLNKANRLLSRVVNPEILKLQ